MAKGVYARLADILGHLSFGMFPGPELDALLTALFDEQEAETAVQVSPLIPEPPETVAERLGKPSDEVAARLDDMADKGLLYCSQRGDDKRYKLIALLPGIFELQFMRGEVTPRAKELARLFHDYFEAMESRGKKADVTPFARVIPIEKTVSVELEVFPYEEAGRYIDAAKIHAVSTCYCRHKQRLLGEGCDNPDEVCMQFGPFARFLIQRGFAKQITREEAHAILKKSEEAGLIHTSNNTRDRIDFICNCCSCCCGILQSVKSSTMPSMAASSSYIVEVDEDSCTGCGVCVTRCQMDALSENGDTVRLEAKKCIGCGVCVTTCPGEALTLKARPQGPTPAKNVKELIERQMADRMRLTGSGGGV